LQQIVLLLLLRHTEQHTRNWTKTEHGKVKNMTVKYGHK